MIIRFRRFIGTPLPRHNVFFSRTTEGGATCSRNDFGKRLVILPVWILKSQLRPETLALLRKNLW